MRVYDYKLINAGDLSLATLTSAPAVLDSIYGFAMQAVAAGTGTGTLAIQGSCDPFSDQYPQLVTNWTQVTTAAIAAGTVLVNLDGQHYKWVRVVYTRAGGTGTLTVNMHAKGV